MFYNNQIDLLAGIDCPGIGFDDLMEQQQSNSHLVLLPCNPPSSPLSTFIPTDEDLGNAGRFAHYLTDATGAIGIKPLTINLPTSTEQVVEFFNSVVKQGESVTVQGTRSGIVRASIPTENTHILSLDRMTGLIGTRTDEAGNNFIRVQSGTTLNKLHQLIEQNFPGYFYPVDPTYQDAAIGGNVSTNASGKHTLAYGSTRQNVSGLTAVLPDGGVLQINRGEHNPCDRELELISIDGKSRVLKIDTDVIVPSGKSSIGPHCHRNVDVIDMLIGAEGTLGVITEVEVKLLPKPKHHLYSTSFFNNQNEAFAFAKELKCIFEKENITLTALEFIDENSLRIAKATSNQVEFKEEAKGAVFFDVASNFKGEDPTDCEQISKAIDLAVALYEKHNGLTEASGFDNDSLKFFTVLREAVPVGINSQITRVKQQIPEAHKVSLDMTVPFEKIEEIYEYYKQLFESSKIAGYIFGHFGSGHLHVNVIPNSSQQFREFKEKTYFEIAEKIISLGGSIAGEHGIGREKVKLMHLQFSDEELVQLKAVKDFFDPHGILNPGVLYPQTKTSP